MYSSKFVMLVVVDGKILPERIDGSVLIPIGSAYTLVFKNKHKVRAKVEFSIDGENVSGNGYIIRANDSIEIKRHHDKDAAFKVVDLYSEEAIQAGKDENIDGEKGVIEAKFYLEKSLIRKWIKKNKDRIPDSPIVPSPYQPSYPDYEPINPYQPVNPPYDNEPWVPKYPCQPPWPKITPIWHFGETTTISMNVSTDIPQTTTATRDCATVYGDSTGQIFNSVMFNAEENYVALRIVLRGYDKVLEVLEEEILYCTNCGQKKGRKADRFCGKCGQKL